LYSLLPGSFTGNGHGENKLMAKRVRVQTAKPKNSYFTDEKANIKFVSTGCTLLDCALGGGAALGRTVNVVGDKSTAKTGTATEVMINFSIQFPKAKIAYRETEEAWDDEYAEAMGLPIDRIDFGDRENPIITVEDFHNDFEAFCDAQKGEPGLYVLDSFDALSDEAEMARDIDKASFGAAKAKKMSEMFRKITRKQAKANVLLLIVSQVRDNIGAMFGEKHKRSGGKALDFYASQVFWLAHIKILRRTINKVERPYGIEILAKVKKNKVGMPFREAQFIFEFGFGINDLLASVTWLNQVDRLDTLELKKGEYKEYVKSLADLNSSDYADERARAAKAVKEVWAEVETTFLPKRQKYA